MSAITVETKYVPASDISLPALAIQVTRLVDSYMLWVGTTDGSPENVSSAPQQGSLSRDWACAMPPAINGDRAPATSLFRSSGSGVALSMAQRLAQRFGKQVFLSVDLPSTDGFGPMLLRDVEKAVMSTLKTMEAVEKE